MPKDLINFKAPPELREAIRIVAFNEGHSNSSKTILAALEKNPSIQKELKKLDGSFKKKPS